MYFTIAIGFQVKIISYSGTPSGKPHTWLPTVSELDYVKVCIRMQILLSVNLEM